MTFPIRTHLSTGLRAASTLAKLLFTKLDGIWGCSTPVVICHGTSGGHVSLSFIEAECPEVGTQALGSNGCVQVSAPPGPHLLTLSKWLNLPEPQFPHRQNEDDDIHYSPACGEEAVQSHEHSCCIGDHPAPSP